MMTRGWEYRWTLRAMWTLVLVGAGGCARGISYEEYHAISAWLTCDDCTDGEREQVAAIGTRAIPFLAEALDSLPGNRRDNMRSQYWELHQFIESGEDSATFVNRYLESMETMVRIRSVTSLADVGAADILQAMADSVPSGFSPEVIAALEVALLRTDLPPVGTGPGDTWGVVEPGVAVELCNGMGATACTLPQVPRTELVAQASGPATSFSNPWATGTIHFFFAPSGSGTPPREVGQAGGGSASVQDDGIRRFYRWTVSFSPRGFPPGPIRVFAVAVPLGDEPVRSTENDNVRIVEGR
jgi:hypothetical protein